MTNNNNKLQFGLMILVPLVISMLFMGFTLNNSQGNELELDQSEPGVIGFPQIHLKLMIDGRDIEGDSSISSMERFNTIEVWSFRHDLITPRDTASGASTGRRQHSPVIITKRVDKSSISLNKALINNELVSEALFRFYRPSSGGSGAEEMYYSVLLRGGYITSFRTFTLIDYSTHQILTMEEVSFVYNTITWTYELGGATIQDTWGGEQ